MCLIFNNVLDNIAIHYNSLDFDDKCGTDLKWYIDASGNLIISGTGEMTNWDNAAEVPWYTNRHDIKDIIMENGVTSIGNNAFSNLVNLVGVIVPESVADIGDNVFSECASLEYICYGGTHKQWNEMFDSSVNIEILCAQGDKNGTCGDNLIWELRADGELVIGGIGAMEAAPWRECEGDIKRIRITEGVSSIYENAFSSCINLTSIIIPESVKLIGEDAFYNCDSLERVDVADITTWLDIEFENYDSNPLTYSGKLFVGGELLTELVIPNETTAISAYAFCNCSSLTNVTIPNSVTSIGRNAFAGCAGLTEITIPESAKVVEKYAFSCTNLKKVYWNADSAVDYWPYEYVQEYPAEFFGTEWPPNAVYNYPYGGPPVVAKNMEVIFGDNVTRIPNYMFYDVANLESLTIPRSLTKIGTGALQGKTTLTINYKGNQEEWESVDKGHDLYYYSSQYEEHIGDVTIIHCDSYPGQCDPEWPNYAYINFLDEPQEINSGTCGDNAYWELSDDGTLNITGKGTIVYGGWDRSRINTVNIGYGIDKISNNTFDKSKNLTDVYMANSVSTIDGFNECERLKNIELSKSLKYIGGFSNCISLTKVTLPYGIREIYDDAFIGCTALANINIPNSLIEIGDRAFKGCTSLTNVVIPDSVIYINSYAFEDCNIESITISNADAIFRSIGWCSVRKVYLNAATCDDLTGIGWVEELYIGENVEVIPTCFNPYIIYWNSEKAKLTWTEPIPHEWIIPFSGRYTRYVVMGDGVTEDMISKFFVNSEHVQFVRAIPKTQTTIYDNNDGTLNLTITLPDIEIPDTAKMYVSGMSNGVLKNLTSVQDFSSDTINVTVNKNDKIKIFLWDKNMKPLTISEIVDVP